MPFPVAGLLDRPSCALCISKEENEKRSVCCFAFVCAHILALLWVLLSGTSTGNKSDLLVKTCLLSLL